MTPTTTNSNSRHAADRGREPSPSVGDSAELRAARQRIAELDSELAMVKRASALFDEGRVVGPKALFGIVATQQQADAAGESTCAAARSRSSCVA